MVGAMGKDLNQLTLEELSKLVETYPWFSSARSILASRLAILGALDEETGSDIAAHIGDGNTLRSIFLGELVGELPAAAPNPAIEKVANEATETRRIVAGGDYFSQEDYDKIKEEYASLKLKPESLCPTEQSLPQKTEDVEDLQYYTETLAQIYAEQEYYEQAKQIYSKLILAYPEKSAYFASLIDRIQENIKN